MNGAISSYVDEGVQDRGRGMDFVMDELRNIILRAEHGRLKLWDFFFGVV